MPQTVEIPDHGIAEFPDDMTPDQIKGVIQQKFYATPTPSATPQAAPESTTSDSGFTFLPKSGAQMDVGESRQVAEIPAVQNAAQGALETAASFVPKSIPEAARMAESLSPMGPAIQSYRAAQSIAEGKPMEALQGIPVAQRIPEIQAAEQTPPFSTERFKAGFGTLADLLMVGGIGSEIAGGARPVPTVESATTAPSLTETIFGKQETPLVEATNESLADLEKKYGTPPPDVAPSNETASLGKVEPVTPDLPTGTGEAKLAVGNVQERLAKAPQTLPTETLQDAITGANKALGQMRESSVPTKPIEDTLNEVVSGWQKVIDQRNETTKTEPNAVSAISTGKAESPTVYHVTNAKFENFDPHQSQSLGMHFGDAKTAEALLNTAGKDARIIHAKLDIKNPIKLDADLVFQDPEKLANDLVKRGIISKKDIAPLTPEFDAVTHARDTAAFDDDPNLVAANQRGHIALQKVLQSKGYDALIYPNQFEGHGTSYAVFDPKQIKPVSEAPVSTTAPLSTQTPHLIDQIKPLIDERGAFTRGGDYVRGVMEQAPNDQLVDFLKWSKSGEASPYVSRFGANYAADVLRQRNVPVDEINWQIQNLKEPPSTQTGEPNAVQEPSTGEILQRQPQETGTAGSERVGVEPSVQGNETPQARQGTEAQPQEVAAPKLLRGETQGDLLSSTQPEDLKLVGEQGVDYGAQQAATEKAAADRAQSEKGQTDLFQPGETQAQAEARMQREYEEELLSEAEQHMSHGGDELVDVLKSHGLPLIGETEHYSGELNNLREMFASIGSKTGRKGFGNVTTGTGEKLGYKDIFRKGGGSLDSLVNVLKSKGFDVETPSDVVNLIQDRLQFGKKIYGLEARTQEAGITGLEGYGMGAAGTKEIPQTLTGIKNAYVDKARVERGLPPRMEPLRKTNPEAWDAAMAKIDRNPNAGRELVNEIKDNQRALKPEESALLAHESVTRENVFDQAVSDVNFAKTPDELAEAKQRLDLARRDIQEIYDVGQAAGTESGQSLQARKLMVTQDYSLAKMEATKRAISNDGKPFDMNDPKQVKMLEEVKDLHDQLAEVRKKLSETENAQAQEKQLEIYRQLVKESLQSAKESAKRGGNLQSTLDAAAAKARERIIARRGRLQVTVDPLNIAGLVDEAIIGASHISRGITKFSDWSAQMVKDFGERISPYLKDLFKRSQEYHDAHAKLFEKASVMDKVRENAAEGKAVNPNHVYELAREQINNGIEGLDNVMKNVTDQLQEAHPGITEREVRDAFSGYGNVKFPSREADLTKLREYRRLGQLASAIEDAQAKEAPKKSGTQRDKPTQAIREKMAELQKAMRENGIETHTPEEQLASTNQTRATSLKNQIEDLEKEIKTGQRTSRGVAQPDTPEVTALKQKRDALKSEVSKIREADPAYVAEQNAKQLARYKSALSKRTSDLQGKIARGDYTRPTKAQQQLDTEATQAKAKYETIRQKFETGLERDRLAKRPAWQKVLEQIAGTARASALSGYHTLAKLAGYDLAKLVETPITEVTGAGLSKVPGLRGVFAKANLESGSTIKAIGDFYTGAAIKGMKEAAQVLRTGKTTAGLLYGKPNYVPPKWYDFFGRLHMAEKAPLVTGTQEMYLRRANENAIKQGLDPSNEFTKAAINKAVYDHSQKSILQENNKFADAVNGLQARMEAANPKTKTVDIANSMISTLVKTFLTKGIVRTPANYFAQTIARTPIGLATGLAKAGMANYRGIGNLHPVEANAISALIKTGAVGSAMFALGAIDATKKEKDRTFGGYWEPGRKRGGDDVEWGKIRIAGKQLPHLVTHNPLTESAQMGSTMMRVAMSKFGKKSDQQTQGMLQGGVKAIIGLAGKAPIASPVMRMGQDRTNIAGDLLQGLVPQLIQNIAEDTDSKIRAPKTATDAIKAAIPGLRQTVPESGKKSANVSRRGHQSSAIP